MWLEGDWDCDRVGRLYGALSDLSGGVCEWGCMYEVSRSKGVYESIVWCGVWIRGGVCAARMSCTVSRVVPLGIVCCDGYRPS